MAEILKEWLTERLQRPITWEAEAFGQTMKNGYVIAGVLHSYHVINDEEYFLIRPGNVPEDIKNNWKYLTEWLRCLDVEITDIERESIMDGKSSSLLRLFYQLFLHLDKRDRTNFLKRERKMVSSLVEKMGHRFNVNKVAEEDEVFVDDLSRPLLNERHFIDWQRKNVEQVQETYDFVRHRFSKMRKKIEERNTPMCYETPKPIKLTGKEQKDMETFALKYPTQFKNYSYNELLDMEAKALEQKSSISGSEWAKTYMDNLHKRINKKTDSEEFQKQISNIVSSSMWDMSVAAEETNLDIEIAKKVMKLSQFEKQMCTQIMETKQQARNLYKNRLQTEKEFSEQREHQFNQFLDNVKEQIHLDVTEVDFEKKRQEILHRKLYAEKLKRKRQHYTEICYETVLSLIDYATKFAYFRRLMEDDIPDHFIHEWKNLFFKQQAIFDILAPVENVLKMPQEEEEVEAEVEEIVRLELDRQEVMNDVEFQEYHNYSNPWLIDLLIPNYEPESDERKIEYLGMQILGHVVYTLLEIKYPYPPPRPPADLPNYASKAILRGLPDKALSVPMQILLNLRKIFVVRLESAINFCLRQFKTELIGCTDIELSFDKFAAAAQEEEDKELIRLIKTEDDTTYKINDLAVNSMLGVIPANTKQTQTPKTIPEEEITLSSAAELGRYTYEALSSGDSLTDHLIAAMIVEFLKDQDDINGFVIINYPNTYREAQILEETFLGIGPPDDTDLEDRDDIYLEEAISKHRKKEKDPYKQIRVSRIVNDPHKKRIQKPFDSYFTCYINLILCEDILEEVFIWDLKEDNSELINRFYAILGINYSMYYETIDRDILVQICKYIIGDISPTRSITSLFGENIFNLLDFPISDDKRTKSKIIKPEASLKSVSRMHQSMMKHESFHSQPVEGDKEPSPEEVLEEGAEHVEEQEEQEKFIDLVVEEIKIFPGEDDYEYGEIPISEIIGIALANCWEAVEKTYIWDMSQLFFAKRLQMNCLVPYARYIKDKMEQIITLPSNKQDIVSGFQLEYNNFENDWRDMNIARNEWHCRVLSLQNTLYQICDQRKLFAENQRRLLICDNWTMEELTNMANTYISCMQTELNRSMMTFQAFHDFYFAMIKRMPPTDRISPKELVRIYRDSDISAGDTSASRKGAVEDKVYKQLKTAYQEMHLKNVQIDFTNNPFNLVIENNVKLALKIIKDTNDSYRSIIAKEYNEIAKVMLPVKKKEESADDDSANIEEMLKMNALKCVDEWTMGINGEMFRANLRILALQYKCYSDMKLFNDHIYKTFMEIQESIDRYYLNEIKSVDRLCKYIQLAIENGRRIPETLILENDTFVLDPNLLQYLPPEPPVSTDIKELIRGNMDFRIEQLARLRSQFKIVSPCGIMLQQPFIYLLQDFIFFGKETCEGTLFPIGWKRVDPEQIPKLVYMIFGDTVYVDWRDFLIYCLNIRFPTVEELLIARSKLRCKDINSTELISRNDFVDLKLWYEDEYDLENYSAVLRKCLVKHFLFELFETETDMMNYSALLLAFCKQEDPIEGFVMALAAAIGKKTCYVLDDCEEVVCKLINDKKYRDECRECAVKCSGKFIDKLINKVIDACEGVDIKEMEYVAPINLKAKGKGGKAIKSPSSKKINLQSARTPQKVKSEDEKAKTQSASNIKTTYICPPCQYDQTSTEKPEEKVEEEQGKTQQEMDPNLVYAVRQSVIWNVLRICLPWHFVLLPEKCPDPCGCFVEQVKNLLKRLEVDTDEGDIYVCRLVSDPTLCSLLHKVHKFKDVCLPALLRQVYM